MNLKCQEHHYSECEFIYLKPSSKKVLICSQCIDESNGNIKISDCIGLNKILEANPQMILPKYPSLSSAQINQMAVHLTSSIQKEVEQIKEYYQNLVKSFKAAVKKAMDKSKAQIEQLLCIRETFFKQYTEIAQIEKLKELVALSHNDLVVQNQLCNFIQDKAKEATANTNKIMPALKELSQYKESFNQQQPEKQISRILSEIEEISFFSSKTQTGNQSVSDQIIPKQSTSTLSIISQITMNPSNNIDESTENIKIDRDNNQIQIQYIKKQGQCVFESPLNPKKKYILTLQAVVAKWQYPKPGFSFGVMPFYLRHYEQVKNTGICYDECSNSFGISKMLKGKKLHLGDDCDKDLMSLWRLKGKRRFEIRINLENKIVKVGVLPNYTLVAEIDNKEKIDVSEEYTFAIFNTGNNNIITLEDICEVDSFDELM